MKKQMTITVKVLAIVFGGIIAYNVIRSYLIQRFFHHSTPPAVTVSTVTAKEQRFIPKISAVGHFVASKGVDVNAQSAGIVVAIHFNSGQSINEGEPLIDIDDSVDEAVLKANQSELTLRELNYNRQLALQKQGATPSSSVDEARAFLLKAKSNIERITALIRQKHITAPFSGRLGIRQVNLGQYITPGETSIVTLQAMDPLYLNFYLPEQTYPKLHINQKITFHTEEHPNWLFEGKITAINSRIDVNTHNIEVQATIPNCPREALHHLTQDSSFLTVTKEQTSKVLRITCHTERNKTNNITDYYFIPGMFAAIDIEEPALSHVIVLPSTAISYSLYGDSVYVVEENPDTKQLHVKRVLVSTGQQEGNNTLITQGIKAGQRVVSSGELKLQNGTEVIINNDIVLNKLEHSEQLSE